jgi:hypothetical protein
MNFRYDTYCGLYCGACELLNAFKDGRQEEQAKMWNMNPEDLKCYGCKSGDPASWCKDCEIKECAISKNHEFCFECDQYPCKLLKELQSDKVVHHASILRALERIKNIGREKWLSEQAKRWSCPECGTPSTWYRKKCENCSSELIDCIAEESSLKS